MSELEIAAEEELVVEEEDVEMTLLQSCVYLLQRLIDLHDQMKEDWATCKRLIHRSAHYFEHFLQSLSEDSAKDLQTRLEELRDLLQEIHDFVTNFVKIADFGFMSQVEIQRTHCDDVWAFNERALALALKIGTVPRAVNWQNRHDEDIAVSSHLHSTQQYP